MRAWARRRCGRPRPSARTRRRAFWSRCLRPGRHPRNTRPTPKWPPSDPASHAAPPPPRLERLHPLENKHAERQQQPYTPTSSPGSPPDSNDSPHGRKKMLQAYRDHAAERAALGIPPLPLNAGQVAALVDLIRNPPAGEAAFLLDLLARRVPPGVDDAAKVKASFLAAVAHGELAVESISKARATELLGTTVAVYNNKPF